jgi:hypothetical protein
MHFTGFAGAGRRRANTDTPHARCGHHAATDHGHAREMTKRLGHTPTARSPIVPFQVVNLRLHRRTYYFVNLRPLLIFAKLCISCYRNQWVSGTFVRSKLQSEARCKALQRFICLC